MYQFQFMGPPIDCFLHGHHSIRTVGCHSLDSVLFFIEFEKLCWSNGPWILFIDIWQIIWTTTFSKRAVNHCYIAAIWTDIFVVQISKHRKVQHPRFQHHHFLVFEVQILNTSVDSLSNISASLLSGNPNMLISL